MSDTPKLEQMIFDLTSEMRSGFQKVDSRLDKMDSRFESLEGLVLDVRDEMRANDARTQTLLHQAFTHISDQLAREGDMDFVPKYPRSKK